jgi:periplasmic divalent cation tolerance protein
MERKTVIIVITTSDSREEMNALGACLVRERLAACAQVSGPLTSHYVWEGQQEESEEWQLRIKTLESLYPEVERRIRELHSYDLPQIVAVPALHVLDEFRKWVESAVSP